MNFFVRSILLFDEHFEISVGFYGIGLRVISIRNQTRSIRFFARTRIEAIEWVDCIRQAAYHPENDFTQPHPYMSFAPPRMDINAGWFVDGQAYMNAVADVIEMATEEIYITDWWFSPTIQLKRPATQDNYWRLDKILERKASQGVHVFVLLYNDVNTVLQLNSEKIILTLRRLHENIRV